MKKVILTTSIILLSLLTNAQDIIYKSDGTEIKAKILELTSETIKYKKIEQLEGPTRNILLSDVFMIVYEDGTKEVIKTKESNDKSLDRNDTKNSTVSINNISFNIVDGRVDKTIGKAPAGAAKAVGLIVQPKTSVKDKEGKIYSYAVKKLTEVIIKKGLIQKANSDFTLELKILELYHDGKTGLYGGGGKVTQNCKLSILLRDKGNNLFQKDFNSLHTLKTKEFIAQCQMLNSHYSRDKPLSRKEERKFIREEVKKYSSKGHFFNFIIVFDDIVNQLLSDIEFQNFLTK